MHRGSLVVLDASGAVVLAAGATDRPTLPRSSNKPVQATTYLAASMLDAVGLGPDDLGCPPALPIHDPTFAEWLAAGRAPDRLAMNCSGKHAAMLSACVASGWPTAGYLDPEHPLQQAIEARLAEAAGEPVTAVVVDGCGAP